MRKGNQILGTLKCDECNKVNEWYYIVADKMGAGRYNVSVLDPTKAVASLTRGTREQPEEFKIHCKECDKTIFFEYVED
jgi:hypothetical protein